VKNPLLGNSCVFILLRTFFSAAISKDLERHAITRLRLKQLLLKRYIIGNVFAEVAKIINHYRFACASFYANNSHGFPRTRDKTRPTLIEAISPAVIANPVSWHNVSFSDFYIVLKEFFYLNVARKAIRFATFLFYSILLDRQNSRKVTDLFRSVKYVYYRPRDYRMTRLELRRNSLLRIGYEPIATLCSSTA